jgi:hypothetical protein
MKIFLFMIFSLALLPLYTVHAQEMLPEKPSVIDAIDQGITKTPTAKGPFRKGGGPRDDQKNYNPCDYTNCSPKKTFVRGASYTGGHHCRPEQIKGRACFEGQANTVK